MIAHATTERADLGRMKRAYIHACLWVAVPIFAVGALLEAGLL